MAITPVQVLISSALAQKTPFANNISSPANPTTNTTTPTNSSTTSTVSSPVIASSSLQAVSLDIAELISRVTTAQVGTQQISTILQNLQNLAIQASVGDTDPAAVSRLQQQFTTLYSEISTIAASTNFGGTNLLNGSLSTSNNDSNNPNASLTVPNLSAKSLFGNTPPSIGTPESAASALSAISQALDTVGNANGSLENASNQIGFAAASVESAQANNDASTSTLTEGDLSGGLSNLFSGLLSKPAASANAQTGKLPDSLLSLLTN